MGGDNGFLLGFCGFLIGIFWFISCFVVASAWGRKGMSYGEGFAMSFFFSPFLGVLIGILKALPEKDGNLHISTGYVPVDKDGTYRVPLEGSKKIEERVAEESKNTCPSCGKLIESSASFCIYCGYSLKTVKTKKGKEK